MQETLKRPAMRSPAGEREFRLPLLWVLIVFYALMLLRDVGGVSVPALLVTVLSGIAFLFLPENEDFALLFAIIPFASRLNFNEIALLFFIAFFLRRFNRKFSRELLLMLGILFIELVNILMESGDLRIFAQFSVIILIGCLMLIVPMSRENILTIVKSYITSAVLICLDVFYLTFSHITVDEFFTWGYRFGRITSFAEESGVTLNFDSNELSVFITVAFYLLTMLWYVRRVGLFLYLPVSGFLLLSYALTQSRGGLVSLIVFFAFFWLFSQRSAKDALKISLFSFAAIFVIFILLSGPLSDIYERFVYRFSVEDVTSGRGDIWNEILTTQIQEPLRFFFGFGTRGYSKVIGEVTAHNTLLDVYASWGIVGIGLVTAWHLFVVKRQSHTAEKRAPLVYWAPLLAVAVNAMTLQFYIVAVLSLILCLSELCIRLSEFDEDRALSVREVRIRDRKKRKQLRAPRAEAIPGSLGETV